MYHTCLVVLGWHSGKHIYTQYKVMCPYNTQSKGSNPVTITEIKNVNQQICVNNDAKMALIENLIHF